jgi:hypothetical protein
VGWYRRRYLWLRDPSSRHRLCCQQHLRRLLLRYTIPALANERRLKPSCWIAWYEWWPANPLALSININPGDSVTLSVAATSTTSGTVTIENNTSGKSVSQNVSSTAPLCQQNAEWILEAYVENGDDVPFADFHSVKFTKASAGLLAGGSVGPAKAAVIGIEQVCLRPIPSIQVMNPRCRAVPSLLLPASRRLLLLSLMFEQHVAGDVHLSRLPPMSIDALHRLGDT